MASAERARTPKNVVPKIVDTISISDIVVIGSGDRFSEADADRIRRAVRSKGLGPAQLPPKVPRSTGSTIRIPVHG